MSTLEEMLKMFKGADKLPGLLLSADKPVELRAKMLLDVLNNHADDPAAQQAFLASLLQHAGVQPDPNQEAQQPPWWRVLSPVIRFDVEEGFVTDHLDLHAVGQQPPHRDGVVEDLVRTVKHAGCEGGQRFGEMGGILLPRAFRSFNLRGDRQGRNGPRLQQPQPVAHDRPLDVLWREASRFSLPRKRGHAASSWTC